MSWPSGTVPTDIAALRTALNGSPAWAAAGGALGQIHYPTMTWLGATLPAAVLDSDELEWQSYGDGSGAIPRGRMKIMLYLGGLLGDIENLARTIGQDLPRVQSGLLVRNARPGRAGDIQPSETGPISDASTPTIRGIIIDIVHGLDK